MTALQDGYHGVLWFTLRHKWIAPVVGLALIGSAAVPGHKSYKNLEPCHAEMCVGSRYHSSEARALWNSRTP